MRSKVFLWLLATMLVFSGTAVAGNPSHSVKKLDVRLTSLYNSPLGGNYNLLSSDWKIKSNYRLGMVIGVQRFEDVSHLGAYFGYEFPQGDNHFYSLYSNLGAGYWLGNRLEAPYLRVECGLKFKLMDPFYVGIGLDEYFLFHEGNNRLHNISISLGLKF